MFVTDEGGIPSQFPVQEDTQFCQILRESLDFFGIDERNHSQHVLVDHKSRRFWNTNNSLMYFNFLGPNQPVVLQTKS